MAITTINLTDPVSTLVTKTNTISGDVGDVAQLITGDSNTVDAINSIYNLTYRFNDSAEIATIARNSLAVQDSDALGLSLAYDSDTGTISLSGAADAVTVRSYLVAGDGMDYDSATGVFSIGTGEIVNAMYQDSSITQSKMAFASVSRSELKDNVSLIIYDSAGTPVKTLYGAGS
jgi:lipopolysaccharide export system protein LptA